MAKKNQNPVQTTLFDISIPETVVEHSAQTDLHSGCPIIFKVPNREDWRRATDMLTSSYTKDGLLTLATLFREALRDHTLLKANANGQMTICQEVIPIVSGSGLKDHIAEAIAFMLTEPDNLRVYTDSLSEGMQDLWRQVLVNIYVSEEQAKRLLNTDRIFKNADRWYSYFDSASWAQPGFDFFDRCRSLSPEFARYHYRENRYFIKADEKFCRYFFRVFFPEAFDEELSLAQLPEGNYRVFDMEQECQARYTLMSSLLKTGRVALTAKGISLADIKRAARQLGLEEFYVNAPMRDNIRSTFYISMMGFCYHLLSGKKKNAQEPAYHELLQRLFAVTDQFEDYLQTLLLPHIKGLRKKMTDTNNLQSLFDHFCQWMTEEPERWVPVQDIFMKVYELNIDLTPEYIDTLVFWPFDQKAEVEIVNEFSGKKIAANSFVMEFGYASLQAIAFMFASLGMAELALSPIRRNDSPFAEAEYIRLTPLGRYVLGVSDDYEAPEQEHIAYFELDPERLIIRSLVDPNPYAQLLLDTSVAISRNRFETSPQSFLAHCVTRKDVEEKIGIFQQFVSNELPPLWKQFFDSLLQHCNPLTKERPDFLLYRLAPDNIDLIRLLTTSETLKKLYIRAEGYLILVKKDDQRKFTDELKKHGYLL